MEGQEEEKILRTFEAKSMGAGRYLGIEPQNEVPVNDLWNSLPSLYYLLSHVSSPGTFSKRSEGKNKGPESRSGSSSQLLTLSPKQASRCCESQEKRILNDNNLLRVQHVVVYILVGVYPCSRDSMK